ncbi:MAG: formyltransferase family protein [Verrucomicrobiales bacterium]
MSNQESVVVFAYNFPHRKTQDFLFRLLAEKIRVSDVLAADPVKLNIPSGEVRTKVRHSGLIHPGKVAAAIGARYHVLAHRGAEIVDLLSEIRPSIGVIAGARILKRDVIGLFDKGIINFHPGLIPEARGLDALLWSVRNAIPLGITSHLIDHRVDAGRILERREITLHHDDNVFDLSERLYETQMDMLSEAIERTSSSQWEEIDYASSACNTKMTGQEERETVELLPSYLQRFATDNS